MFPIERPGEIVVKLTKNGFSIWHSINCVSLFMLFFAWTLIQLLYFKHFSSRRRLRKGQCWYGSEGTVARWLWSDSQSNALMHLKSTGILQSKKHVSTLATQQTRELLLVKRTSALSVKRYHSYLMDLQLKDLRLPCNLQGTRGYFCL